MLAPASQANMLSRGLLQFPFVLLHFDVVSESSEKGKDRSVERNSGKRGGKVNQSKSKLEDDVDALFRLPLTEFISARKTLAARLKKEGHGDQASLVKALVKPSISAWAVNQLYWMHREVFDHLIATGQNFGRAQSSRLAGKVADMREALDARRE